MVRIALIAPIVVLCAACSRTELAYRNADWLLEYYARQTVAADATQRDRWQPLMASTLQYHREQELPLIVAYLDQAGRAVAAPDSAGGAACLLDGALFLARRHARLAVDLAVPLLADLDASQVEHLADYLADSQDDATRRYLAPDPQRREQDRQQRLIERIENWTGKLDDSQRQRVYSALTRMPDLSAAWLAYRARHGETLLAMLQAGSSATELRAYLTDWWVERQDRSAEYSQDWDRATHELVALLDGLNTTLSERQRSRVEQRLGQLRKDLASFIPAAQAPVSLPTVVTQCSSATT
jgi:hypothetical protein